MDRFMRLAIEKAREGIKKGGGPFGACIVKMPSKGPKPGKAEVIACEHNSVRPNIDSSAHAEINAIRAAEKALNTIDLSGCIIYSTTEPCPMCFSAIHWAKIDGIVFGTSTADAKAVGFNELMITDKDLKKLGKSPVKIISAGVMKKENLKLFDEWKSLGGELY